MNIHPLGAELSYADGWGGGGGGADKQVEAGGY